jgi:hypothetical protein
MSRSFVLSELQRILYVSQFRLEMQLPAQVKLREKCGSMNSIHSLVGNQAREMRDIVRPATAPGMQSAQFWPRVEMLRLFVLSELRHILHIELCRVEMRQGSSKLAS